MQILEIIHITLSNLPESLKCWTLTNQKRRTSGDWRYPNLAVWKGSLAHVGIACINSNTIPGQLRKRSIRKDVGRKPASEINTKESKWHLTANTMLQSKVLSLCNFEPVISCTVPLFLGQQIYLWRHDVFVCSTQYFRYACWLWKHVSIQQKSPIIICTITSWWLNQPIWKICSSNWSEFPQNSRNENKQIFELPPPSIMNVLFPSKKCHDLDPKVRAMTSFFRFKSISFTSPLHGSAPLTWQKPS